MERGKSINLFLMDGNAIGRIKCTLTNWTGVTYKIPRTALDKCKERCDLKQSGIYFLFGTSDDTGDNIVYVGQAGARKNGEGLLYRLQEHNRNSDKDYWTEAIVFTTSNNSFGPTEISYLENRFYRLALETHRYNVVNSNDPTQGNVTEAKESELEEFIDYSRIVMGALGHKVFEPVVAAKNTTEAVAAFDDEPLLYFKRANINAATGRRTSEGFVVLKESTVVSELKNSCPKNVVKLRERYKNRINSNYILTEDLLFASPSAAAAFVGGYSLNGNETWKTADGISLKYLETSERQ